MVLMARNRPRVRARFRMYIPAHHFHVPEMVARIHRHLQNTLQSSHPYYQWRFIGRGEVLIPARRANEVPLLAQTDHIELKAFRERPDASS